MKKSRGNTLIPINKFIRKLDIKILNGYVYTYKDIFNLKRRKKFC